jgi:hypothetical protein
LAFYFHTVRSFETVFKVIVYATAVNDAEDTQNKKRGRVNL